MEDVVRRSLAGDTEATHRLVHASSSREFWGAALSLLNAAELPLQFYGAHALYTKARRGEAAAQLSAEESLSLTHDLIERAFHRSAEPLLADRLLLAAAALAVRAPGGPALAFDEAHKLLRGGAAKMAFRFLGDLAAEAAHAGAEGAGAALAAAIARNRSGVVDVVADPSALPPGRGLAEGLQCLRSWAACGAGLGLDRGAWLLLEDLVQDAGAPVLERCLASLDALLPARGPGPAAPEADAAAEAEAACELLEELLLAPAPMPVFADALPPADARHAALRRRCRAVHMLAAFLSRAPAHLLSSAPCPPGLLLWRRYLSRAAAALLERQLPPLFAPTGAYAALRGASAGADARRVVELCAALLSAPPGDADAEPQRVASEALAQLACDAKRLDAEDLGAAIVATLSDLCGQLIAAAAACALLPNDLDGPALMAAMGAEGWDPAPPPGVSEARMEALLDALLARRRASAALLRDLSGCGPPPSPRSVAALSPPTPRPRPSSSPGPPSRRPTPSRCSRSAARPTRRRRSWRRCSTASPPSPAPPWRRRSSATRARRTPSAPPPPPPPAPRRPTRPPPRPGASSSPASPLRRSPRARRRSPRASARSSGSSRRRCRPTSARTPSSSRRTRSAPPRRRSRRPPARCAPSRASTRTRRRTRRRARRAGALEGRPGAPSAPAARAAAAVAAALRAPPVRAAMAARPTRRGAQLVLEALGLLCGSSGGAAAEEMLLEALEAAAVGRLRASPPDCLSLCAALLRGAGGSAAGAAAAAKAAPQLCAGAAAALHAPGASPLQAAEAAAAAAPLCAAVALCGGAGLAFAAGAGACLERCVALAPLEALGALRAVAEGAEGGLGGSEAARALFAGVARSGAALAGGGALAAEDAALAAEVLRLEAAVCREQPRLALGAGAAEGPLDAALALAAGALRGGQQMGPQDANAVARATLSLLAALPWAAREDAAGVRGVLRRRMGGLVGACVAAGGGAGMARTRAEALHRVVHPSAAGGREGDGAGVAEEAEAALAAVLGAARGEEAAAAAVRQLRAAGNRQRFRRVLAGV